jgi:hypothetical protein
VVDQLAAYQLFQENKQSMDKYGVKVISWNRREFAITFLLKATKPSMNGLLPNHQPKPVGVSQERLVRGRAGC